VEAQFWESLMAVAAGPRGRGIDRDRTFQAMLIVQVHYLGGAPAVEALNAALQGGSPLDQSSVG